MNKLACITLAPYIAEILMTECWVFPMYKMQPDFFTKSHADVMGLIDNYVGYSSKNLIVNPSLNHLTLFSSLPKPIFI